MPVIRAFLRAGGVVVCCGWGIVSCNGRPNRSVRAYGPAGRLVIRGGIARSAGRGRGLNYLSGRRAARKGGRGRRAGTARPTSPPRGSVDMRNDRIALLVLVVACVTLLTAADARAQVPPFFDGNPALFDPEIS